jgi:hypothetical protein
METENAKRAHIRELDGVRGIAILMVHVWHYVSCVPKEFDSKNIFYYLNYSSTLFWSGVDLFFCFIRFSNRWNHLGPSQETQFLESLLDPAHMSDYTCSSGFVSLLSSSLITARSR